MINNPEWCQHTVSFSSVVFRNWSIRSWWSQRRKTLCGSL